MEHTWETAAPRSSAVQIDTALADLVHKGAPYAMIALAPEAVRITASRGGDLHRTQALQCVVVEICYRRSCRHPKHPT